MSNLAIIGHGVVGSSLARVLNNPIIYDPPKKLGSIEELNQADIVFICVPTPFKNGCDISLVEESFKILEGKKVVIIKSTVVPGTTEYFQQKYPQHKVLFSPEFLTEKNAEQDMKNPDRQIIGYTKESYYLAEDIMRLLPIAPYEKIMPATEAEMVKYYTNSFLALKVAYANQIYDLCQALGIDYNKVKEGMSADKRIGKTHLDIHSPRGYNGKCLPKDTKALLEVAEVLKVDLSILKQTDKYNGEITKL